MRGWKLEPANLVLVCACFFGLTFSARSQSACRSSKPDQRRLRSTCSNVVCAFADDQKEIAAALDEFPSSRCLRTISRYPAGEHMTKAGIREAALARAFSAETDLSLVGTLAARVRRSRLCSDGAVFLSVRSPNEWSRHSYSVCVTLRTCCR